MEIARMACDIAGMARERKPLDIKIGKAIQAARKARGLTSREVAQGLETSIGAVGNWERGANRPDSENLFAVAELLKIDSKALARGEFVSADGKRGAPSFDPDSIEDDLDPDVEVPVVGYVGAGAEAHYYQVSQGELDRVPAPKNSTKKTVAALDVRGTSLGPLLNGWLVYYDEAKEGVQPEHLGRLCVVGLPDDRVLVKQIRPSRKFRGLYDLISNDTKEDPIEGVEITWAATVTDMKLRS